MRICTIDYLSRFHPIIYAEKPGFNFWCHSAAYWQDGGRYLCIPCDGSIGKTFITEIDLSAKFFELFGKKQLPVTALGIEVDVQTTEKVNGRHSKAFIKRVELF